MTRVLRLGGGCVALAVFWAIFAPYWLKSAPAAPRTEAINNIKQISLELQEFDSEYGCFPSADTIAKVKENTHTDLVLGDESSNQLFRQLIATGFPSEKPFYAKIRNSKKPDGVMDAAHALEKGECSFAYVTGLSSSVSGETPVVMVPMIPGTLTFDPKPFDRKAIILCVDNSARAMPIDAGGHVIVNGMDILDPRQSFWYGKAPQVRCQE